MNFKYKKAGSSFNYNKLAKVALYQFYGVGYQFPLEKGNHIEIFTKLRMQTAISVWLHDLGIALVYRSRSAKFKHHR